MERTAFGSELNRALAASGRTAHDVAREADVTASLLSMWQGGSVRRPDPHKVFAVEKALDLPPGQLSRHLGFVPATQPRTDELTFRDWLMQHGHRLSDRQRDLLEGVYEEFVGPILTEEERADAMVRAERGIAAYHRRQSSEANGTT